MNKSQTTYTHHSLAPSPKLYAWVQPTVSKTSSSDVFADWYKDMVNSITPSTEPAKPEPILDMEEAYKEYLENIMRAHQVPVYTSLEPVRYTSKGVEAQTKLDKLRNSHPELFL